MQAAQQRLFSGTILRGLTQPLNAYGYKYLSLLLLLFYSFVIPADLSQQTKSAILSVDVSKMIVIDYRINLIFQYFNQIPGFQPKVNIFLKNSIFIRNKTDF
jgi:Ca2+/H+ antiporter